MPEDLNFLAVVASAILVLAAIFIVLFRTLLVRERTQALDFESLQEFSSDLYRPMRRLMNEGDYKFLETQPGYSPEISRSLRSERKRVLVEYLQLLADDFHQLLRVGRTMIVLSETDQADFAKALSQIRNEFYWNLLLARVGLVLSGGEQHSDRLISALDLLADQVQALQSQLPAA